MKPLFLFFALLVALRAAGQPNILLVLSDDHSVPHLGCYGNPDIKTPNFDKFAAEGMRFNRAYTTAPQCAPSRKSILSGRSPVALQQTLFTIPLQKDVVLFPEILRSDAGYFTGLAGRTHHLDGDAMDPVSKAIHEKHHLHTAGDRFDSVRTGADHDGQKAGLISIHQYRQFLDEVPAEKPFFLQLCFTDPHRPWDDGVHPYRHDPAKLTLPAHYPDFPETRADLANYYDEIARLDSHFGTVLQELEKRGLAGNTIVLFMGDNGGAVLRGKGTLYEYGLNVPFLIRWPGVVKPGVSDAIVSGEDIAPTFLEITGRKIPDEITGKSFAPLLRGEPYTERKFVFGERGPHVGLPYGSAAFDQSRTIIGKRYKLIYNAIPSIPYVPVDFQGLPAWKVINTAAKTGSLDEPFQTIYDPEKRPVFEMYDLRNDPSELSNLFWTEANEKIRDDLLFRLTERMVLERDHLPLPLLKH